MEVRRARNRDELDAALAVRDEVFVREQGVTVAGDRDGRDEEAIQLVAITEDGEVVGTCRLLIEGPVAKFGRLAVLADRRGQGLGEALLLEAEREAHGAGAERIVLNAQTRALSLYERAGYSARGGPFMEEGIEHVTMEKAVHGA
jgi:predicted GNAT family N-acyltransferase